MNTLFGISLTAIAAVLVGLLAIALAVFLYAGLRNPVLFRLGLRNIPRRRAQTLIIVFGLMVSTMIITAAFTVGDSLSTSITKETYDKLGVVDLIARPQSAGTRSGADKTYFSDATVSTAEQGLGKSPQPVTWLPLAEESVPAGNPASKLTEPVVNLIGLDPGTVKALGGLRSTSGKTLQLTDLADGQVYINASAADKLAAKQGDTVVSFFEGKLVQFTVRDVARDEILSGWQGTGNTANGGIVLPLAALRAITGRDGVNQLWLSTSTNGHAGLQRSEQLWPAFKATIESDAVKATLTGSGLTLKAENTKHDNVQQADQAGNIFTTFFLLIGLFSIAAGMMLIFLIFVMLAAERRSEMGMARAVGIKRMGLVQSFLAEGMVYNLAAGMVGVLLGVSVATGLVWFATNVVFTGKFSLPLSSSVSQRSLIVSYCLGVVLTFITVVFSAYRTTRMNIVAAIRDMPEDTLRSGGPRRVRGRMVVSSAARLGGTVLFVTGLMALGAKAGVVGLALIVVGLGLLVVAALLVTRRVWGVIWRTLLSAPYAGIAWGVLGLFRAFGVGWAATWSVICVVAGLLGVLASHGAGSLFFFSGGVSITALGLALFSHNRGLSNRAAFTSFGAFMLVFWLLPGHVLRNLVGDFYGRDSGGPEMFFLAGIMLMLAATLVLVFNGELLVAFVNRAGGVLGSIRPSLATALAYPMASKLRTGITVAMFFLIIFSITVMSTINTNFSRLFLSKDATGGWDVVAVTGLNNPIPDLNATMQQNGIDTSKVSAIGATSNPTGLSDVRMAGAADWQRYFVRAANPDFLDASTMKLQAHVRGQPGDGAWKELQQQPNTALIDARALAGGPGGGSDSPNFRLKGVKNNAKLLDQPIAIEVRNPAGGVTTLNVIGVIDQVVQGAGASIFVSDATYRQAIGAPDYTLFAMRLVPGTDDKAYARQIKANLGRLGVDATSIRSDLEEGQRLSQGISYLFQGFMGLGLLVGIAAVGVIAARNVVERRQQIGMLRAVGYRSGQVALSFVLETSFIALFGLISGVAAAAILSYNLFTGDTFGNTAGAGFVLPYGQILLFAGFAYLASLAMTYVPSRKAAGLPIAEALRYE